MLGKIKFHIKLQDKYMKLIVRSFWNRRKRNFDLELELVFRQI